jgi:hypothetical protein
MDKPSVDDIAAMREQGDLRDYLLSLVGGSRAKPKPVPLTAVPGPDYRVAHVGGWPLGTAATGPTPPPDVCTCAKCGGNPAARNRQHQEGDAA